MFEQLLSISAARISVREQERMSIAREIHDDIGQAIVAVTNTGQIVPGSELFVEFQQITTLLDSALQTVHRVIANLRPEAIERLGLSGAIEWQAHDFQDRTGIPVQIRSELETTRSTDPHAATALFRIFQELLNNVAKHAMASRVEATLGEDKEFLLMQIKDDGIGISKSDLQKTTSFGLLGLKERVFLLHGNVEIQGVPDKGTTVTVRIPLHFCTSADEAERSREEG